MSDDKLERQEKLNQYIDERYGFKREEFDSYIDKLNAYRKEEFLEDDLIDKDLAWEIRGSLGSHYFGKTLLDYDGRGTKVIVIWGCLITIFSMVMGSWLRLDANSYLIIIAFLFFLRHMCRMCDYYKYVINPKNFGKDGLWDFHHSSSREFGFMLSAIHFEGIFLYIFLSWCAPLIVLYNLLLCFPMAGSPKKNISKYRPQDALSYLLDFAELNIAVPFWTCFIVFAATVTTLQPACPWIIFPLLPITLYFKKKLDFQFLLKNVLLNYQKCQKGQ